MLMLIVGSPERAEALKNHAIMAFSPDFCTDGEPYADALEQYDWVLHLNLDERPELARKYLSLAKVSVVASAVKKCLGQLVRASGVPPQANLFGLNALPTFLEGPKWECSAWPGSQPEALEALLGTAGVRPIWVADEVGMVTPRVLSLIINEAYLMRDEGTAQASAIDAAMKLGTNYPFGPFEWAKRIGRQNLLEILEALAGQPGAHGVKIARSLRQDAISESLTYDFIDYQEP